MTIEVLQAEKDIDDFVHFLYESGYNLSHRDGSMRNIVLTQSEAINSLMFDLYMSGGTYYIGDSFCSNLIGFDSCGMQSHPSKVETQGRFAGKIAIVPAAKEQATPLFNRIRRYIKKTMCSNNITIAQICVAFLLHVILNWRKSYIGPIYQRQYVEDFCI